MLDNIAPRILKGDFNPGFYVEHFIKDMGIALEDLDAEAVADIVVGGELRLELHAEVAQLVEQLRAALKKDR